jgi:hypothetical protein
MENLRISKTYVLVNFIGIFLFICSLPVLKGLYRVDWVFFPFNYIDFIIFLCLYILGQSLYTSYITTTKIFYRALSWLFFSFVPFLIVMQAIEQKTEYLLVNIIYYNLLHMFYLCIQ